MNRNIESKEADNRINADKPEISEESRQAFIRAMKIGYYKAFYKQGLITDSQLERLIDMNTIQHNNAVNAADDNNNTAS